MRQFIGKVNRRLKKEFNKIGKKINPKIEIPVLDYSSKMDNSLRVAIVGLGNQGHKLSLYLHNMNYNVVAICDLNSQRRKSLKKKLPDAITVNNIKDLKNLKIDICVLATLADSHLKLIKEIHQQGVTKILSEKPITNSVQDNVELTEYISKNNILIEVFHPALFSADMEIFKDIIENLDKGKLINAKLFFKPGGMGNIGSHVYSTFLYLTGAKIDKVLYASFINSEITSRGNNYADPNGKVIFESNNGAKITVENTKKVNSRFQKLLFEYEKFHINLIEGKRLIILNKYQSNKDKVYIANDPINSHLGRYKCIDQAMINLVENKKSHSMDLAISAIELIIGSHSSFKQNKCIPFPLDRDTIKYYNFS